MSIEPAKVNRDEDGYWVHPGMPEWDEGTSGEEIDRWFSENHLSYWINKFEDSDTATDAMHDAYYNNGDIGVPDWQPECPAEGAFLLSIHDTEEGPVAVFAIPK